jgi:16S rRNA (guanine966-N2)-methyltransferase
MRVVAGSAKGKTLLTVPGEGTRPIMDRVKTALFDVLRPQLSGMVVLDVFAGSGSVGIEALSQGAEHCTFLDLGSKAVATIKKNLATTGFTDRADVRHIDAFRYLTTTEKSFDLIYVAPPQFKNLWVEAMQIIASRPELMRRNPADSDNTEPGLVVAQIDAKEYRPLELGSIEETKQKRYGNTLLVFYELSAPAAGE